MLQMEKLKGIIVPVVTPVTKEGKIDEEGLRNMAQFLLDGGVHGLFPLGSTGNFCAFNLSEKQKILKIIVDEIKGRVLIAAGVTDLTAEKVIENIQMAAEAGVDMMIISPPFYYPMSENDALTYFRQIAQATNSPILIYNNPSTSNIHITASTIQRMIEEEIVVGCKDSSYDFSNFQKLLDIRREGLFRVFQGIEEHFTASLLMGADGAILSIANVIPKLCVEMYSAVENNDYERLRSISKKYSRVVDIISNTNSDSPSRTFFVGLQSALKLLGICDRISTLPFTDSTEAEFERTRHILKENNII